MECFVFDIDGTLLDTEYAHMEGLRRVLLEQCGKEYTYEELRRYFGIPSQSTFDSLGIEDKDGNLTKCWHQAYLELSADVRIFDGIQQVLDIIHSRNIPMGVVTSQCREELENTFKRYPLQQYFEMSIHADLTKRHKPFSDPLDKFFELTEISKAGALYVGDSKYDWECAKAAGVAFGLAGWGCGNPEGIYPDYYFHSPADLLNLI